MLIGKPLIGKGTAGKTVAKKYNVPIYSTGEYFRDVLAQARHQYWEAVWTSISTGKFAPDKIANEAIDAVLAKAVSAPISFADGYPRTENQARHAFDNYDPIVAFHFINVSDEETHVRLDYRRKEGRIDDKPEVLDTRLEEHRIFTPNLLEFLGKRIPVYDINANPQCSSVEESKRRVAEELDTTFLYAMQEANIDLSNYALR